jgi:outer membrane receptor protein involved in Fe transport
MNAPQPRITPGSSTCSLVAKWLLPTALALSWPGLLSAQTVAPRVDADEDDATVVLSPFVVDTTQDRGYQATNTLAGTRIRTALADVGSSISVLTKEFLRDINATDNEGALMYAINTEVGGPRGNFSGGVTVSTQNTNELSLFANPSANTRVRGLTNADNTRNYFIADIPWDGYTVSRVDLQRGPNAILFGLGSPAGVVNTTIDQAEFATAGSSTLRSTNSAVGDSRSNTTTCCSRVSSRRRWRC